MIGIGRAETHREMNQTGKNTRNKKQKEKMKMNTNIKELNLNEIELVNGGSIIPKAEMKEWKPALPYEIYGGWGNPLDFGK